MTEKILQERLRIKAGVMEMGEKIAWGSDTALMREAADRIDSLEQKMTERKPYFDGDTCGRMCEGTAYRIEARQQKYRADVLAATIRELRDVVTHDCETKDEFIARVRAVLAEDPDARLTHNDKAVR